MNTGSVVAERRTRTAVVQLVSNGIVYLKLFADVNQTLEDAQENVRTGLEITQGHKPVLLIDARRAPSLDREPRSYYMSREVQQTIGALAVVLRAHPGVAILRFVSMIIQGLIPSRVFTNEDAAIKWLQRFVPASEQNMRG